jgi:hypothetical protein
MIARFLNSLLIVVALFAAAALAVDENPTYPYGYRTFVTRFNKWSTIHGRRWLDGTYKTKPANGQYEPWYGWRKAAEHFGDPSGTFERYATAVGDSRRDAYFLKNDGRINSIFAYTEGFARDWVLNHDTLSRDAVVLASRNASFAANTKPLSGLHHQSRSRECMYTAFSYLMAEVHCGAGHRPRMMKLLELALGDVGSVVNGTDVHPNNGIVTLTNGGHIEQWLGSYTTDASGEYVRGSHSFAATDYAPFMGGLTAYWLIRHNEHAAAGHINGGKLTADERVLPKLIRLADATWNECWEKVPRSESFYLRPSQSQSAPDLNNVIFPYFAWLYLKTGESRFRTRCDRIFHGSRNAYLTGSKQFNQYIRWTFDGLTWYSQGVATWK